MKIGIREIGGGQPAYIIAEMSANHAGDISRAKEIIHAAKEAGADCIKIQTYTPDTLTIDCDNSYFHISDGTWNGENLYQLYQKAYTPWEWQKELFEEAKKAEIDFFSTPFDNTSVDFLEEIGIGFYKIASFELVDIPLIEYVASTGKPMILSTGMATLAEIDEAVEAVKKQGNHNFALLRCASAYPAITDEMNLRTMQNMGDTFGVPYGLSDHSMGSVGAVTAVALGASIIEKHFCLDRSIENPDSTFSMNPMEFKQMVHDIRQAERAIGSVKYGPSEQEKNNLQFRRSIFCVKDIQEGEKLTEENIRIIRPGYGLAPKFYKDVLGQNGMGQYLRKATIEDRDLLFQWANDPLVRKNSFSTAEIAYEEHVDWYNRVLDREDCIQYIYMDGEYPVGQARITLNGDSAEIGYSICEEMRSRGYGQKLLALISEKVLKEFPDISTIFGEVKPENYASQNAFLHAGYTETYRVFQMVRDGEHGK